MFPISNGIIFFICITNNRLTLVLSAISIKHLRKTSLGLFFQIMEVFPEEPEKLSFSPVCHDDFLPESPASLLEKGAFNTANVIAGYTADEGTTQLFKYIDSVEIPHINATEFDTFLAMHKMNLTPLERNAMELVYFDGSMLSNQDPNYFDAVVRILTDYKFACPTDTYLRGAAQANVGSVYGYVMTHHPSTSLFNTPWSGSAHGDDLIFFGTHFTPNEYNLTDDEVEMSLKMIQYWTNFAKTG